MEGRRFDRLLPWIAGSLLLLGAIVIAAMQVPDLDCAGEGDSSEWGPSADVLVVLTVAAVVAAVGGGLYRLGEMTYARRYGRRDGWILGAVLLVLAAAAVVGDRVATAGGGLATGGLVLAALAFAALVVAAITGRDAGDVGLLLPVYLFAAAYVYLAIGAIALLAKSGIGC